MAVMGVRIGEGTGVDTSVSKIFADALFGNPDRDMKFARLQSDLATDEYQRAQIRANEDYIRSRDALERQKFQGNEAMVDPLAKLGYAGQLAAGRAGLAPTEAPAPVELGPDPYAPIPADRPVVAEAPVPVELGPDPYAPIPADRPASPPIELPPSANPTASTLSSLMAPDMPVPVLQAPSVEDDPATLEDLLSPQPMIPRPASIELGSTNQFRAMPSDAVAPATLGTMNVTPGQEEEGPGDLPVPVDETEFVDPNAGRTVRPAAPAPEPFVDPNVGREPRPEEVKAVADAVQQHAGPIPDFTYEDWQGIAKGLIANGGDIGGNFNKLMGNAMLTYGDPSNGDKLRQAGMLITGNTPTLDTMVGAADTSGVNAGTAQKIAVAAAAPGALKSGLISDQFGDREPYKDAQGNTKMRWISGGIKNDEDLKKGLITGKDGLVYKINPDSSLTVAEGQTGADANGHLTGTGENIQHYNRLVDLNRLLNEGKQLTDDQKLLYAQSYQALYPSDTTISKDAQGKDQASTVVVHPPVGTRKPDQLVPGAISTTPAVPATGDTTAPATTTPAPATGAEEAAAAQPAATGKPLTVRDAFTGEERPVKNRGGWLNPGEKSPVDTDVQPVPGATVTTTTFGEPKGKAMGVESMTAYTTAKEAIHAARILNQYGPGGKPLPSGVQQLLEEWQSTGLSRDMLEGIVDQETREYARAVLTFINAPKRTESGAAVNAKEIQDYVKRYTMHADNLAEYKSARNARAHHMTTVRSGLTAIGVPPQALKEYDIELSTYGDPDIPVPEGEPNTENGKVVRRRPNPKTGVLEEVK